MRCNSSIGLVRGGDRPSAMQQHSRSRTVRLRTGPALEAEITLLSFPLPKLFRETPSYAPVKIFRRKPLNFRHCSGDCPANASTYYVSVTPRSGQGSIRWPINDKIGEETAGHLEGGIFFPPFVTAERVPRQQAPVHGSDLQAEPLFVAAVLERSAIPSFWHRNPGTAVQLHSHGLNSHPPVGRRPVAVSEAEPAIVPRNLLREERHFSSRIVRGL
ncbi:hypothetical protein LY78DRAFT_378264 [Colletotrichum sublineola]|nr:hypothetical protein LY78DRAFT_378264 [Colletotrichum sublineola]